MASQSTPSVSVKEYLDREEQAIDRHEYLDGEVFAMAGGPAAHSDIGVNITTELRNRLKGRDCKIRGSDMRIRTSSAGLYSYADAVVSSGEDEVEDNTLLNPVVIAEVLSKSTESEKGADARHQSRKELDCSWGGALDSATVLREFLESYDRGRKFEEYRQIPSFREYIIVAQSRPYGEHHIRAGNRTWTMSEFSSLDDVLHLAAIGVDLPLSAIYSEVSFSDPRVDQYS